jgi:hypothetical protein
MENNMKLKALEISQFVLATSYLIMILVRSNWVTGEKNALALFLFCFTYFSLETIKILIKNKENHEELNKKKFKIILSVLCLILLLLRVFKVI